MKDHDNETEIHLQEFKSNSYEHEEGVRGNKEIELITGIEVDNEEPDHILAVPVLPIAIRDLENQIDPDIDIDTVNISSGICLYLFSFFFFLFRLSTQIT